MAALPLLLACSSTADGEKPSDAPGGVADAAPSKNGADGCPVASGFDGDESCLAAPEQGSGIQMHYGPSDYDDPADVARFTLEPGQEVDKCFFLKTPNETDFLYSQIHGSMRPGSHHFIARAMTDRDEPDGFQDCAGADTQAAAADSIGGSQFREFTFPPDAPDYAGLAGTIPAGRQGMLNGHFINSTEGSILSEAWLNYLPADESAVTGRYAGMALTGGVGMRIEPATKATLHYSCSPGQTVRLLTVSGHFHAHTTHFSAWKVSSTGEKTLIMEAFNWEELASFYFDSVTKNSPSDAAAAKDGATSGPITIAPDESVEWECLVDNTSDAVLKFRNEVQTGEMCMVVGTIAAVEGESAPFTCLRN